MHPELNTDTGDHPESSMTSPDSVFRASMEGSKSTSTRSPERTSSNSAGVDAELWSSLATELALVGGGPSAGGPACVTSPSPGERDDSLVCPPAGRTSPTQPVETIPGAAAFSASTRTTANTLSSGSWSLASLGMRLSHIQNASEPCDTPPPRSTPEARREAASAVAQLSYYSTSQSHSHSTGSHSNGAGALGSTPVGTPVNTTPISPQPPVPLAHLEERWHVHLPVGSEHTILAVSPAHLHLAVVVADSPISVHACDTGAHIVDLAGHDGGTNGVLFIHEDLIMSTGEDGRAAFWQLSTEALIADLECSGPGSIITPHGPRVSHPAVSPDRTRAAMAAGDTVHLVYLDSDDMEGSREAFQPLPGRTPVNSLRFSRDGLLLAAFDGGCMVWPTRTEGPGLQLRYASDIATGDVAAEGRWVVAACGDATMHVWKLPPIPWPPVREMEVVQLSCVGCGGGLRSSLFSPSSRYVAAAGGHRVTIWDFDGEGPSSGVPAVTVGHTRAIACQLWQPLAGSVLITGAKDGRVLAYDATRYVAGAPNRCLPVAADLQLGPDRQGDPVVAMATHNGADLLVCHASGAVRCLALPACARLRFEARADHAA